MFECWKINQVRLVINMLLTLGSILKLAMRRCVLGKDALRLFSMRVKQSTRCGGQIDKTCKQNIKK